MNVSWRTFIALVVALAVMTGVECAARADTTATTTISVTTEDAGTLTVAFGELVDGYVFRDASGSPNLAVSAIAGTTATATVRVSWNDTRTDANRLPFQLILQASDLKSADNAPGLDHPAVIPAARMAIVQIGADAVTTPLTIEATRVIYTSPEHPAAGAQTLDLVIRVDIPASSPAVEYKATLTLSVAPVDDGL